MLQTTLYTVTLPPATFLLTKRRWSMRSCSAAMSVPDCLPAALRFLSMIEASSIAFVRSSLIARVSCLHDPAEEVTM